MTLSVWLTRSKTDVVRRGQKPASNLLPIIIAFYQFDFSTISGSIYAWSRSINIHFQVVFTALTAQRPLARPEIAAVPVPVATAAPTASSLTHASPRLIMPRMGAMAISIVLTGGRPTAQPAVAAVSVPLVTAERIVRRRIRVLPLLTMPRKMDRMGSSTVSTVVL
jgi:hypothetical protein